MRNLQSIAKKRKVKPLLVSYNNQVVYRLGSGLTLTHIRPLILSSIQTFLLLRFILEIHKFFFCCQFACKAKLAASSYSSCCWQSQSSDFHLNSCKIFHRFFFTATRKRVKIIWIFLLIKFWQFNLPFWPFFFDSAFVSKRSSWSTFRVVEKQLRFRNIFEISCCVKIWWKMEWSR